MKNNKRIVMMASIILIFAVAISGTIAWLFTSPQSVVNTFTPGAAPNVIEEITPESNSNVKEDVYIIVPDNSENVPVYIRATYIVTWQDGNNNMLPAKPMSNRDSNDTYDYIIEMGTSSNWVYNTTDGYYYYKNVVNPGDETDIFIESCYPVGAAPEPGYTLHVEILSQSIQADGFAANGDKAVEDAWGVDPESLS